MNLISDTLGYFAGSMTVPIYLKVINDDMTEIMGFRQATSSMVRIIGNLAGGFLIGFVNVSTMAGINVLTFIFVYVGLLFIRKPLEKFEAELTVNKTLNMENHWKHMGQSLKTFLEMTNIVLLLTIGMLTNVVISDCDPNPYSEAILWFRNRTNLIRDYNHFYGWWHFR